MIYIVLVNGKPESGKTTFEEHCLYYADSTKSAYAEMHSSIDYIKDIYKKLGWNGIKTDKARKDLSILKQIWIDNCNGPLNAIVKRAMDLRYDDDYLSKNKDYIVFTDVREESEIIKYKEAFEGLEHIGIRCIALFVLRPDYDSLEYNNKSDNNVGSNMSLYDYIINNNDDINHLMNEVNAFMYRLLKGEIKNGTRCIITEN